jgi:hypothetical protein
MEVVPLTLLELDLNMDLLYEAEQTELEKVLLRPAPPRPF